MLNRKMSYGTIGGTHEFNAAFEQFGRLFDIHGYEIDKNSGTRLEGPESPGWRGPQPKAAPALAARPPHTSALDDLVARLGGPAAAIEALQGLLSPGKEKQEAAPVVGLSMEALNNPPASEANPQAGDDGEQEASTEEEDDAAPTDIIDEGLNLSAWARGELPNIEFMRVKPLVKKLFDKNPANAAQAVAIINKGLPE